LLKLSLELGRRWYRTRCLSYTARSNTRQDRHSRERSHHRTQHEFHEGWKRQWIEGQLLWWTSTRRLRRTVILNWVQPSRQFSRPRRLCNDTAVL